jgi:plasmid stability protein
MKPVDEMSKMIQLRNVPDDLHRRLKARAAKEGVSLSDYLIREVRFIAEQPTLQETLAEIAKLPPITWREPVVETVRKARNSR